MPTLNELVAELPGLVVPVAELPDDLAVRAVHVTELQDPTPYLDGGELLLSTGLAFGTEDPAFADFVERLAANGVAGLVLGIGPVHRRMPEVLARACAEAGLPLFKGWTPFLTITRTFWALLAQEDRAPVDAALGSHRLLARAATSRTPVPAIVRVLAETHDGWAVRLDVNGMPMERWPRDHRLDEEVLGLESGRLRQTGPLGASSFPLGEDRVVLHSLSRGGRLAGFVAVGSSTPATAESRFLIVSGCVLLAALLGDASFDAVARRSRNASVCDLVLLGEPKAARLLASHSLGLSLPQQAALGCLVPGAGHSASEILGHLVDALGDGVLWGTEGVEETFCLVEPGSRAALEDAVDAIRSTIDPALAFALSPVVELAGIADRRAATSLAANQRAAAPGRSGVPAPATGTDLLRLLLDSGRPPLVPTVAAWIRHRGSWEAASRELGTHRNTVRSRIAAAEDLIGASLSDPDVAAGLWLAIRAEGLA